MAGMEVPHCEVLSSGGWARAGGNLFPRDRCVTLAVGRGGGGGRRPRRQVAVQCSAWQGRAEGGEGRDEREVKRHGRAEEAEGKNGGVRDVQLSKRRQRGREGRRAVVAGDEGRGTRRGFGGVGGEH
jgi:hypothetical protein